MFDEVTHPGETTEYTLGSPEVRKWKTASFIELSWEGEGSLRQSNHENYVRLGD